MTKLERNIEHILKFWSKILKLTKKVYLSNLHSTQYCAIMGPFFKTFYIYLKNKKDGTKCLNCISVKNVKEKQILLNP